MRLPQLVLLAALLSTACGPPADGGDASVVRDGAPLEAGPAEEDAPTALDADAGCLERPGELLGERLIANGRFPALSWEGREGSVDLLSHHQPCVPAGPLVVLRQLAAWSAHARWHAAHTAALRAIEGVVILDLWVADASAMPMTPAGLEAIEALYDVPPDAVLADPGETLAPLAVAGILLPTVAVLDARTLDATAFWMDPRAGELEHVVAVARARLRGEEAPPALEYELVDGRFTQDRWDLIQDMARPFVPPPSPSNRVADDADARALGARLFDDPQLSPHGVSCRSCHDPDLGFADALPLGFGVAEVTRNTPTIIGVAGTEWPFWDGRVDSVWAQATGPIENPREMASTRLFVAHRVADAYRAEYEALFGALPELADLARFPAEGMPGDAGWGAMTVEDREAVTRVFSNVAKAIEAHERTVGWEPGRFEAYAAGDLEALTEDERDGLASFFLVGCAQCHWGPRFANDAFFAIGMPGSGEGDALDLGRLAAFSELASGEFRRTGPFSDELGAVDPLAGLVAFPASTRGAFRTPTLRAIRATAPYGHAGTFATLTEVLEHYAQIRWPSPPDPFVAGVRDPHLVSFEDGRIAKMVAFLEAL